MNRTLFNIFLFPIPDLIRSLWKNYPEKLQKEPFSIGPMTGVRKGFFFWLSLTASEQQLLHLIFRGQTALSKQFRAEHGRIVFVYKVNIRFFRNLFLHSNGPE